MQRCSIRNIFTAASTIKSMSSRPTRFQLILKCPSRSLDFSIKPKRFGWIGGAHNSEMLNFLRRSVFNPNNLFETLLAATLAKVAVIVHCENFEFVLLYLCNNGVHTYCITAVLVGCKLLFSESFASRFALASGLQLARAARRAIRLRFTLFFPALPPFFPISAM